MKKVLEEIKNKDKSIEKLGIEKVLDDLDYKRRSRQEFREQFIRSREQTYEERE